MKITIIMRFPLIQNAEWKKSIIERLIKSGHEVSILFGESSYFNHFLFALKDSGFNLFKKKASLSKSSNVKIFNHFKNKIPIDKVNSINGKSSERFLKKKQPDILLLLGSGIIRDNILKIPKRTLHCHIGKLPEMRGANTLHWSILLNQDLYVSMRLVDKGIDTGSILNLEKIDYLDLNTIPNVYERCYHKMVDLIVDTINNKKFNDKLTFESVTDPLLFSDLATEKKIAKEPLSNSKQYFVMHPFLKKISELNLKEKQ